MYAKDVMSRPVLTVRPDDSIEQAAALLTSNNIAAAPVVDAAGDLVGMVSERDLLQGRVSRMSVAAQGQPGPGERPVAVADVMTKNVVVMPLDADLADVADAMLHNDMRSVPVVDEMAQLTGIISRRDILRSVVRTDDTVQLEVQHRLDEYAGGERRWTVTVCGGVAAIAGRYTDEVEEKIIGALTHTVPGVTMVRLGSLP